MRFARRLFLPLVAQIPIVLLFLFATSFYHPSVTSAQQLNERIIAARANALKLKEGR